VAVRVSAPGQGGLGVDKRTLVFKSYKLGIVSRRGMVATKSPRTCAFQPAHPVCPQEAQALLCSEI
jgi:hypothetical protein